MKDFRLLALSFCFIFSVFCAYAILRPVCDALGIHDSTDELKWLFLGTFVFTLFGSFVAVQGFYMWASVFNLFIISLAQSLLNDVFSKDSSKKFFGIITAGASLGSIAGASFVAF